MVDRQLYQKLFDTPNPKACYTNSKIYDIKLVSGNLDKYEIITLDIYHLGSRLFALHNGKIVAGPHKLQADLVAETNEACNLYYGPDNLEFCSILGLSRRSAVDIEELVTNCKNTKLQFFSAFLANGELRYIRHNGLVQVDNDSIGKFIACVEPAKLSIANLPSESLVRIKLMESIKSVKEPS